MAGESIGDLNIQIRASADRMAADIISAMNAQQGAIQTRSVALGNLIASGIQSGIGQLKSFITSQIGSAMNLAAAAEDTSAAFRVLLGDADKAKAMIASFRDIDASSALRFDDLADAGKVMLGYGASAENIIPTLRMLGDVSMGNSEKFKSLSLAYSQVMANTRLMGQELNQLINAGFNPLTVISAKTGESMVDLKKRMEDGKVSFAEVQQAFISVTSAGGKFFGMTAEGAKTFSGKMSMMGGAINAMLANVGAGVNEALKPVMDDLGNELGKLAPLALDIGKRIGAWVLEIYKASGGFTGMAVTVANIAQGIDAGMSAAKLFGVSLIESGKMAFEQFKLLFESIKTRSKEIEIGLKGIAVTVADAILDAVNGLKNGILNVLNELKTQAIVISAEVAKVINPGASAAIDTGIKIAKENSANFQPDSVVADLPTGSDPGSPGSLLFPDGPGDMTVDYTALDEQIKETEKSATESLGKINAASVETDKKLYDMFTGATWGKELEKKLAENNNTTKAKNAELLTANTAATNANIELANKERSARMQAAVDTAAAIDKANQSIQDANERTYEQFRSMNRDVVTDIVTSWATGTGRISDMVNQWANQMIKEFIRLALFGNKTKDGGGGSIGGLVSAAAPAIGSFIGGFFAEGGRPPMGKVSVVGESGPELFVPDSAGRVIPNNKAASFMSAGGGGGGGGSEPPVIFNFQQSFGDGVSHAQLAGMMDQVEDASRSGVLDAIRRGGSFRKGVQS